ncbi:hypothetical protein BGZ57DRAFT_913993 [Hyaloscypha finlandica]|nr:hypothetical protein BGZ57DRAFT_913993 [Hyaloscypha finlandica]
MQATAKEMVPQDGDCPDDGEFVDSAGTGDVEDVSGPLERYDQGLYYHVRIGEVLAGRYRIEHKLGWGEERIIQRLGTGWLTMCSTERMLLSRL